MPDEKIIESLSRFTRIPKKKIEEYLRTHDLRNLFEHPETIDATRNQLENLKYLITLKNLYVRVSSYKEYKFEKATDMVDYLDSHFYSKYDKEYFLAAFLDKENKVLGIEKIFTGTLNASIVHPRDVFKQALIYKADKIVLAHNHPSGVAEPSEEDIAVTGRFESVGELLNIPVLDHIIIGKNEFFSFREEGYMGSDIPIKETSNKSHETLYREDVEKFADLLSKVTKISETKLKDIFAGTTVKELIESPEFHLKKEEEINSINMIKDIYSAYKNACYRESPRIQRPDVLEEYVKNEYKDMDKVDIVLFLNAQYKVINSMIIPDNLSEKKKVKFIMENAILHDSCAIASATKDSTLPYEVRQDKVREIINITANSARLGIDFLDHIDIGPFSSASYRSLGYIDQGLCKAGVNKGSMEERLRKAKIEAEKRNSRRENEKTKEHNKDVALRSR